MFYFKKISGLGKVLYPSLVWNIPEKEKSLYLTFDDGPHPEITPWVLNTLQKYEAKASFFCVGKNAKKYPDLIDLILAEGHTLGNHTYNHLNGWKTSTASYVENVLRGEQVLKFQNSGSKYQAANSKSQIPNSKVLQTTPKASESQTLPKRLDSEQQTIHSKPLFRPPYGRITPGQIRKLQELDFKIVMWEVISGDFDENLSAENCYNNVIKNCKPGSIVVFHDSIKASVKLKEVLPRVLEYYSEKGFEFKAL